MAAIVINTMLKKPLQLCLLLTLLQPGIAAFASDEEAKRDSAQQFVQLLFLPQSLWNNRFAGISDDWQPGNTPMAIEMLSLSHDDLAYHFVDLLQKKTGQELGYDVNQWFTWWWKQDESLLQNYPLFKSKLYGLIDKTFEGYFSVERTARIRLDEVRWGGVKQDGIPPLRQPKMITAKEADYLDDDNIVFGIEINGDARAYPKRILAWHEMFVDQIGGIDFAGVYCTLCGAVILYKTRHNGVHHHLGTSGFLYRSNKLMYDKNTQSLWNTTWGEPVIGPLADKNIRLERSYLVTTTWGEWKRRHPDTTVLSLDTGHRRDYGEGIAYKQYFSSDELMFSISTSDDRLQNKDEVLALTFPQHSAKTMAIAADFLRNKPVYKQKLGELAFVVLTDASGANRVFETGGVEFVSYDQNVTVTDSLGKQWHMSEDRLSTGDNALARLPAHRAFWFGWHSAFPDTVLIK